MNKINYEEAWFNLIDRIKSLHNIAGDLEEEPAHSIYHNLLDNVIPSVLEQQYQINMYSND